MIGLNFQRCEYDVCVYFRNEISGNTIYLLLYVDNKLLTSNDLKDLIHIKQLLKPKFERKDLGKANKILSMKISRNREKGE